MRFALYDPLTQLPNRALYQDRVNNALQYAKSDPTMKHAIFYMDLDKFKMVNDTYGHLVGDKLLKEVGERLTNVVRSTDTVARIGGDEFTAIIFGIKDKAYVDQMASAWLEAIEKPFNIEGTCYSYLHQYRNLYLSR